MRTFLRIAVIVYVILLALTLLIISPALNFLPHKYVRDTYGWELRTGWVLLNPFKLSLDISEAALDDASGESFLAFSEASVNLSLESLWRQGWVLDAVRLRDLYLNVTQLAEDEYNFSALIPQSAPEESPEPDEGAIPGITIRDLELHSETIVLNDRTRKVPHSSRWNGLHIRVDNLSTVTEEGRPYTIDLEADGGGQLHWEGEVSLPLATSRGQLSVDKLNLRKLWELAEPWMTFELRDGRLSVEGEYQLDWRDTFRYSVNQGHVGLSVIDIAPRNPDELPDTGIALQTLDINNINLDSSKQEVSIDAVTLDELAVATWREGAAISLEKLFVPSGTDASPEEDPAPEAGDDANWRVALNNARLKNGRLRWRSLLTDPEELVVHPIEASVENIHWPLAGDTQFSLNLTVNEQAGIAAQGALALAEGNGAINYTLDGLPLAWFNPNLPGALKATITGGQVQVQGQVALADFAPTTIALDGVISEFAARQEGAETTLTGWDAVRLEGLSVDMEQHQLVLEKLAIDGYTGRLHINEDGSVNASNIWKEEVGEQAQEIAEDLTEDKPWSFSIPVISLSDSAIDFMDQSLPIHFRTVIGELEGEVVNLSSEVGTAATVDIQGSVDSYAPVSLTGTVAPFAEETDLDLHLTFNGVDMALLSPYSGTYAGYAIDRGLLNLDLRYALQENRLRGNNAVRIEKLKLGEKISSDKAVDLPLELALAILTDSNGVIEIAVPVSGSVDDPGFELGGVISRAFLNLITKAITAPFSLLANLVNSEEDLQRVSFSSGSAKLRDASREKLEQLAAAMEQRPKLGLVITGRLNLQADRARLQKNALKVQLLEQGLSAEEIKSMGPDWEEAITELYRALPGSVDGNTDDTAAPSSRDQYQRVVQSIVISDEQMRALAEQRAVAVKGYLVNEAGLAADRAVVGQITLDAEENDFSGVELGIEN